MTAPRVLVIEDNADLGLGLRVNFEERGYAVTIARTGGEGLRRARQGAWNLLLLDLSLPDLDGLEVLDALRRDGNEAPVIVLTARTQQAAKIRGLRAGADDYVTKPFDIEELLARVEVVLRRSRPQRAADVPSAAIAIGDMVLDPRARTLTRAGAEVPLSRIAFDLLLVLATNPRTVIPRDELMQRVWGYDKDVVSRTLDTHIFELRKLIEPDPAAPRHIVTVWRVGYRFMP